MFKKEVQDLKKKHASKTFFSKFIATGENFNVLAALEGVKAYETSFVL